MGQRVLGASGFNEGNQGFASGEMKGYVGRAGRKDSRASWRYPLRERFAFCLDRDFTKNTSSMAKPSNAARDIQREGERREVDRKLNQFERAQGDV